MDREELWKGLDSAVYNRLCDCVSLKEDILPLTKCVKKNKGYDAEQSLCYVLEHLDCNSQFFDLTREEYDAIIKEVG